MAPAKAAKFEVEEQYQKLIDAALNPTPLREYFPEWISEKTGEYSGDESFIAGVRYALAFLPTYQGSEELAELKAGLLEEKELAAEAKAKEKEAKAAEKEAKDDEVAKKRAAKEAAATAKAEPAEKPAKAAPKAAAPAAKRPAARRGKPVGGSAAF